MESEASGNLAAKLDRKVYGLVVIEGQKKITGNGQGTQEILARFQLGQFESGILHQISYKSFKDITSFESTLSRVSSVGRARSFQVRGE